MGMGIMRDSREREIELEAEIGWKSVEVGAKSFPNVLPVFPHLPRTWGNR